MNFNLINNKPNIKEWDLVSKTYDYNLDKPSTEIANILLNIFKKYKIKKSYSILELGSGSGKISAILAKNRFSVTLLDFSHQALLKAKQLFFYHGLSANFIEKDLTKLSQSFSKYDVIWNSGVFEHFSLNYLYQIFKNIYKKCNHLFVFLIPNKQSFIYQLWRYKLKKEKKWTYGTEYLYDKEIVNILKKSGFKKITTSYSGWNFSLDHINIVFQEEKYQILLAEMINKKVLPQNESYLKIYICQK